MRPAGSPAPPRPGQARRVLRRALRRAERGFALAGVLLVTYHLCFDLSAMASNSMAPTLRGENARDGDWVLTEKVSYWLRRPRRWEVVTFLNHEGLQVMKRVAGLPGESVSLRDDWVAIDGAPVERPAGPGSLAYLDYGNLSKGRAVACGQGYYLLGDHTRDSLDSRYEGPVERGAILGRAWLVVWPLSRFGRVGP